MSDKGAQFAVALETGGMVVPEEYATELLEHLHSGEPIRTPSRAVFTFHVGAERYRAAELRAALANVEARDAAAITEYLRSLGPIRWYRR